MLDTGAPGFREAPVKLLQKAFPRTVFPLFMIPEMWGNGIVSLLSVSMKAHHTQCLDASLFMAHLWTVVLSGLF